ncbi:hypothetical protein IWX92DRAFT_360268 [Phyllosticta citricarpa]
MPLNELNTLCPLRLFPLTQLPPLHLLLPTPKNPLPLPLPLPLPPLFPLLFGAPASPGGGSATASTYPPPSDVELPLKRLLRHALLLLLLLLPPLASPSPSLSPSPPARSLPTAALLLLLLLLGPAATTRRLASAAAFAMASYSSSSSSSTSGDSGLTGCMPNPPRPRPGCLTASRTDCGDVKPGCCFCCCCCCSFSSSVDLASLKPSVLAVSRAQLGSLCGFATPLPPLPLVEPGGGSAAVVAERPNLMILGDEGEVPVERCGTVADVAPPPRALGAGVGVGGSEDEAEPVEAVESADAGATLVLLGDDESGGVKRCWGWWA